LTRLEKKHKQTF